MSYREDSGGLGLFRRLQGVEESVPGLSRNSMDSFMPSVGRNPKGPRLFNVSDRSRSSSDQNMYELEENVESSDSSKVPMNATSAISNDDSTRQLLLKVLKGLDDVQERLSRLESSNLAASEVKANSTISYITSKTSETTAHPSPVSQDGIPTMPSSTKKESVDDEISSQTYVVPPSYVTDNAVKSDLGFHIPNGADFGRQFALQDTAPIFGSDVYIRTPVDGCPDKGSTLPHRCNSTSIRPFPKQLWFAPSGQFYSPYPPDTSDRRLEVSNSGAPAVVIVDNHLHDEQAVPPVFEGSRSESWFALDDKYRNHVAYVQRIASRQSKHQIPTVDNFVALNEVNTDGKPGRTDLMRSSLTALTRVIFHVFDDNLPLVSSESYERVPRDPPWYH